LLLNQYSYLHEFILCPYDLNVINLKGIAKTDHFSSGVANAPKLGDQAAWKKLIGEGQIIITAHGYVGIRAMPPKGGNANLSVEQFSEALNYMVNKSGGNWATPDKAMLEEINKEIVNRKKTQ
jgi:hypothetical protein